MDKPKSLRTISFTANLDDTNIADIEVSIKTVISEHFGVEVHDLHIENTNNTD